jgi:hypothetical protein
VKNTNQKALHYIIFFIPLTSPTSCLYSENSLHNFWRDQRVKDKCKKNNACGTSIKCVTERRHMVSLPDLDCILCSVLCVLCWFILLCHGTFSVLLYSFSVLLYSSVLLCCWLLFILLCSSCYVCVCDCIYCTLKLPPDVNPITVNKYLTLTLKTKNDNFTFCT